YMSKMWFCLESVHHGNDPVMFSDVEIVLLGCIPGKDSLGSFSSSGQDGKQSVALKILSLIYNHKCIGEGASSDVSNWKDFQESAFFNCPQNFLAICDSFQSIINSTGPRSHLF